MRESNRAQRPRGGRVFRIPPYVQEEELAATRGQPLNLNAGWPQLPALWRASKGQGIKIAVLDTGIDGQHPALAASVKGRKNFTGGARDDVTDEEGHGTMVAGIIAARGGVSRVTGIVPEAELYVGKVLRQTSGGTLEALKRGLAWALETGAHVINISLGAEQDMAALHEQISLAAKQSLVICAAGNGGTRGLDFPARYAECIAVGAVTREKNRWVAASGEASAIGRELDIMALGHRVTSTFPRGGESTRSGTSLAAPFVTGVVALALAQLRNAAGQISSQKRQEIKALLLRTADDLPLTGPGAPKIPDELFGYGLVDPEEFLQEVASGK